MGYNTQQQIDTHSATINLSPSLPKQVYAVTIQDTLRISNCITENAALFHFKKTLLQTNSESLIFELETLDFSQTANHELAPLTEEMIRIKEKLVLETAYNGELLRILNKDELRRKWKAIMPVLKARYSNSSTINSSEIEKIGFVLNGDGYLESVLKQSPEYSILFPIIFNKTYTAKAHHSTAIIPRFIGDLFLPLLLETHLENHPDNKELTKISVEGFVDPATYPTQEVQQALRKLTDKFDLDTSLLAVHQESYILDKQPLQEILEASRYTRYEVPGVFGKEMVVFAQLLIV